jgi:long-subunit acyl-CoA synthetase (AMP-forming)
MFKNSNGEFIIPEKIENLFIDDKIQDMFISKVMPNDKLVSIVVCPDESIDEYGILSYISRKGNELVEKRKMARYEIPKFVILIRNGFETFVNQDFVTPTAKKKRNNLERYFKDSIAKALKY